MAHIDAEAIFMAGFRTPAHMPHDCPGTGRRPKPFTVAVLPDQPSMGGEHQKAALGATGGSPPGEGIDRKLPQRDEIGFAR
jgi:hypothetical protein